MSTNFPEGALKISGHIKLGAAPTLACGTWNGVSMDTMSEKKLTVIIDRIIALKKDKFSGT